MTRLPALLLLSALTTSLAAQSADLRATLDGLPSGLVQRDSTLTWTATIENLGPDAAEEVRVVVGSSTNARTDCVAEIVTTLAAGERRVYSCSVTVPFNDHGVYVFATATSSAPRDPDPSNNSTNALVITDRPRDLTAVVSATGPVDRAEPFAFEVGYRNLVLAPAVDPRLTVEVRGVDRLTSAPSNCTITGATAICDLSGFAPEPDFFSRPVLVLSFTAVAPDIDDAPITITATVRSDTEDANPANDRDSRTINTYRTFFVTNTNDGGSGSLRAAIDEANAACPLDDAACKISFRLPVTAAAWATIRPESPLPALTTQLPIDGTTQTRRADTNPLGPEIEISGERLTSGNGLTIASRCGATIRGLALNGFPDNGILVASPHCSDPLAGGGNRIEGVYAGTDPTGTRAIPNLRGIFVAPEGDDNFAPTVIGDSVISGNRYSGIWVASGSRTRILGNVIGLDARKSAPLGNGSSGVYVTRGGSGTDLADNHLSFNGHFGVSIERGAKGIELHANSFQGNGNLAIDYGLDGASPSIDDSTVHPGTLLHAPVITSARYEAADNWTIVEGTVDPTYLGSCCRALFVAVYANDAPDSSGFGEGQYFLGKAGVFEGRFRFVMTGRPPGPFIAATTNSRQISFIAKTPRPHTLSGGETAATSEFSRTVEVSQ